MMSKNSFWGSMIENSKRRIWVWAVSILFFVLALPTYVAFSINRQAGNLNDYIRDYGQVLGEQMLLENLRKTTEYCLGSSGILLAMVSVLAFLAGVQGFSWLYSRKKIDFYMGMPVKRKKRFLIIWLNGILIFLIPYLFGEMLSLAIAAANGGVNANVLGNVLLYGFGNLLLYLGVYHLAILAVMMTGNIVITIFGFGVFCLYEYIVRGVIYSYQRMFFEHFSYQSMETEPFFSPFTMYYRLLDAAEKGNGWGGALAVMILFAAVILIFSYICYLKRPAEAAGRAMVFDRFKPLIKILLVIPAALFAGYMMAEAIYYEPIRSQEGIGFVIFVFAVITIVGCALIQVIYEFDIKGMFHKKHHIVICGVAVAVLFMIFRYDLFAYDAYIPDPEQIESVAFVPVNYEAAAGYSTHINEWGEYMSNWEYADKNMFLTDAESVCALAELSMKESEQKESEKEEDDGYWSYASVIYRLKNGRKVCREFKVNVKNAEAVTYLDRIIGEPEFKKGYLNGASENLTNLLKNNDKYEIEAYYGNMIYTNRMNRKDAAEFIEIYQTELLPATFTTLKEQVPAGILMIDVTQDYRDGGRGTWTVGINVYGFMEKSISYLKEKGYYVEEQLNPEDVERIQVLNYNSEIRERLEEEQKDRAETEGIQETEMAEAKSVRMQTSDEFNTLVYADYTDPEQIRRITEAVYPQELLGNEWDGGTVKAEDYTVCIYFKGGTKIGREYGFNAYYGFLEGQIPEFVQTDTVYKE